MRKTARVIVGAAAAAFIGGVVPANSAMALDKLPTEKQCQDKNNPVAKDAVTQGACVVVIRRKGNCMACHQLEGLPSGDLATPLKDVAARYAGEDGKMRLRAQVVDPRKANPHTVMPPFGAHAILSNDEIDNLVAFLLTR